MDATHLHLLFNHVGILGLLFSACILLVAILLKSGILKRTAMTGFVIAAVAAAVTMNTGEGAEETVEHISGVAEAAIHEHEEAAESTIWLVGVCGLLSLIGLIFYFLSKSSSTTLGLRYSLKNSIKLSRVLSMSLIVTKSTWVVSKYS